MGLWVFNGFGDCLLWVLVYFLADLLLCLGLVLSRVLSLVLELFAFMVLWDDWVCGKCLCL